MKRFIYNTLYYFKSDGKHGLKSYINFIKAVM